MSVRFTNHGAENRAYAEVVADSINEAGVRLTTFEVRFWRPVLAEFNTHCVLSRNSASSRAIPFEKQVARLLENPALPMEWATEQKGMQGGPALADETEIAQANANWVLAMQEAIGYARALRVTGDPDSDEGVKTIHKSIVNRLLEPFMWHTAVVTATAWENFFDQRRSPLAQPEIREVADLMYAAREASTPRELETGMWHLPYIDLDTMCDVSDRADSRRGTENFYNKLAKISAARCARVSYLTQDGKRDIGKDFELYERLVTARPAHWSPLEHVATPWADNVQDWDMAFGFTGLDGRSYSPATEHLPKVGKLLKWRSLRTTVETMQDAITFR